MDIIGVTQGAGMARLNTAARVVRNRVGALNVIGLFWSICMQRHVVYESLVERLMFLYFEWLGKPKYVEQPYSVSLHYEGKPVNYTPDAEVTEPGGDLTLWQAKPKEKARETELVARFESYARELSRRGYEHFVFVPEDRSEQFWLNVRMLYGYAIRHHASSARSSVADVLGIGSELPLIEAVRLTRAHSIPVGILYTEMFYRNILYEPDSKITKESPICILGVSAG